MIMLACVYMGDEQFILNVQADLKSNSINMCAHG